MCRISAYIVFVVGGFSSIILLASPYSVIGCIISGLVTYLLGSIFIGIDKIIEEQKKTNEYLKRIVLEDANEQLEDVKKKYETWVCSKCNKVNTTEYLSCRKCGTYRY